MQDLTLSLIQTEITPDNPEANLERYEPLLEQTRQTGQGKGSDLVILPEVFTTGFSATARDHAEREGGRAYEWLAYWAKSLDAVVTGSLVVAEGDAHVNRLVWMSPDGHYQQYDKRHLFRMAGEHKRYKAGQQRLLVELKGWRILPMVCYDLRFPVWSRNRNDYDLALYVANWPGARSLHWRRLLQARAIENLSFVAGVNRIGLDEKDQHYSGDSTIFGPAGEAILDAEDRAGCFSGVLSAECLTHYRESFPAYLDADEFDLKV